MRQSSFFVYYPYMKVIIPLSGLGSRFVAVGYTEIKPLITVEGRPIIAHVLDMFPGEDDIIFTCREEHLDNLPLRETLLALKPNATIVPVPGHRKGPAYDILLAKDHIPDHEDVIVSYCDFTQNWDFAQFKRDAATQNFAGAVPAYTGFHPHLLHPNVYAGILLDEHGMMRDIKEKHCFTENPFDSHHSSGMYYFRSGELMKRVFQELVDTNIHINGEHYVSQAYYLLLRDQLPVAVPLMTHFMQWGTPQDLEEYEAWSRLIHTDLGKEKATTNIPDSREESVRIPHTKDTEDFMNSYQYWHSYFSTK